ncbi:hypothetical protein [Actinomyces sp. 565]|uniref:hypothetical protein n=1 Tax=Actinomyces sp. 565 TaxID=2057794 RepID=UPI0013A6968D|nr:hypothetical protein [Actinomyces sp. 565]NDR53297.1 hypothetical protein [Actinomyces sp. 565]
MVRALFRRAPAPEMLDVLTTVGGWTGREGAERDEVLAAAADGVAGGGATESNDAASEGSRVAGAGVRPVPGRPARAVGL